MTHKFIENSFYHHSTNTSPAFKSKEGTYRIFTGDILHPPNEAYTVEETTGSILRWIG